MIRTATVSTRAIRNDLEEGEKRPAWAALARAVGEDADALTQDGADLLAIDMRLGLTLPWRIAVYTENGVTRIGLIRPPALLAALGENPEAARLAAEIEAKLIMIVDETR